ncbi:hypothetical protein ACG02S_15775 [Roseateles sp. DC23W]|uniref:DUF3014 domain-containing protein n=1 Tax=Pelomonas dachongensis TaxID=3299029 RepID=A0ABW7EPJ1_9BURK
MNKQSRRRLTIAVGVVVVVGLVLTFAGMSAEPDAAGLPAAAAAQAPLVPGRTAAVQSTGPSPSVPVAAPPAATESLVAPTGPRISVPIDWALYPGTLQTQIQQALQKHDGVMAADLARKLRECDITARLMRPESIQRQVAAGGDPALSAVRDAEFQAYHRILANCQTVVGDPVQLRSALLDVAVARGVIGAAVESFNLGQRRPEVLESLVRDAVAGHVFSLIPVTSNKPALFGMSLDQQRSLRLAFEIAANDPEVGALIRPYVGMAESLAGVFVGKLGYRFDHDGLTYEMRRQAQLTAQHIVERVKVPRPEVATLR